MKLNYWLIIGALVSTSLLAQQANNTPPPAPATPAPATPAPMLTPPPAETNAPAAKTGKKKSAKKKSGKQSEKQAAKKGEKQAAAKKPAAKKAQPMAALKTTPLVPGPAMVVASNINVRGQAKLKSEVVTRVTKGATVTVLEEIVDNKSGPEEPSAWAKILLPPGGHAWVNTMYVDTNTFTIRPKKLNVRSGPGENYSVIGLVQKGDAVKELKTKGEWIEIEPPANAYAFMAAAYLSQETPAVAAVTPSPAVPPTPTTPPPAAPVTPPPPPEPTPTPTTVSGAPTVAPPPTEAPSVPPPAVVPPKPPPVEMPVVTPPAVPPAVEPEVPEGPVPPRIVQREGIVRGLTSIQAPSRFVLISPDNRKDIDYLFTTSSDLDLRRYKGVRVIVTGEEGLDDRWGNTPVLTIQTIKPLREE